MISLMPGLNLWRCRDEWTWINGHRLSGDWRMSADQMLTHLESNLWKATMVAGAPPFFRLCIRVKARRSMQ